MWKLFFSFFSTMRIFSHHPLVVRKFHFFFIPLRKFLRSIFTVKITHFHCFVYWVRMIITLITLIHYFHIDLSMKTCLKLHRKEFPVAVFLLARFSFLAGFSLAQVMSFEECPSEGVLEKNAGKFKFLHNFKNIFRFLKI